MSISLKLEAIIYSEVMGIFDNQSPNGLIQMEATKRLLLNTQRSQWSVGIGDGWGFWEHLDIFAKLSKLEQNNKFLEPMIYKLVNGQETSYFSPLNLLQHHVFSVGEGFKRCNTRESKFKNIHHY